MTTQRNKVAAISLSFWVLKFLATTLGELLGDSLSITLGLGDSWAFLVTLAVTTILLGTQVKATRFHTFSYWPSLIAIVALSSESSDMLSGALSDGHRLDTLIFALCLLILFALWQIISGPIRLYPIQKGPEELFYWVAVFFASGLGVAFGDFLSDNLTLGILSGALITVIVLASMLFAYYATRIDRRLIFWVTFIFTRPFGA